MGFFEIVVGLKAEPESLAGSQRRSETHGRIGRYSALGRGTISSIRRGGTPAARASAFWLISRGMRNSSRSTSPGWMLGSFFMADTASVIVHDLDVVRIAGGPAKADAPIMSARWAAARAILIGALAAASAEDCANGIQRLADDRRWRFLDSSELASARVDRARLVTQYDARAFWSPRPSASR